MVGIKGFNLCTALGGDAAANAAALGTPGGTIDIPGLRPGCGYLDGDSTCLFTVTTPLLPAVFPGEELEAHNSRNNALLRHCAEPLRPLIDELKARHGADQIGVIMGTSTSGVDEADRLITAEHAGGTRPGFRYEQTELGDPSRYLSARFGLTGPEYTISTACSSSARALLSGARLIERGICKAVIAGGADTLSRMPIHGFNSLELLSATRCHPFAAERDGINIGEGAALFVLTAEADELFLAGGGESSDAYHVSAPDPEGHGPERAIRAALAAAELAPGDLGYLNLHGTASKLNDAMEAAVVERVFGAAVPCSSTKHLTGHTLGAAGAVEAALAALILRDELPLPEQDFSDCTCDPTLPEFGLLQAPGKLARPFIMSNSFAFGGNNTSLILGRRA